MQIDSTVTPQHKSPATRADPRPFFGFYGGKWRDTPKHYPPPVHETIVEPFAGSAGYSLRYFDRRVVLCEIDPVIAGIWTFLTRASAAEIRSIPDLDPDQTVDDLARLGRCPGWLPVGRDRSPRLVDGGQPVRCTRQTTRSRHCPQRPIRRLHCVSTPIRHEPTASSRTRPLLPRRGVQAGLPGEVPAEAAGRSTPEVAALHFERPTPV